ncbi:microcephalin-like [Centruroides sculpturatus]|uniref:microcephalin-like n=1 Tax=Centruroides sculpturatus TaxID=218467 RepID=UPI000C6EBEEB|nr:microcephalin-like [Centruroides sculpturatus]
MINEFNDHPAEDFLKAVVAYVEVRSGRENWSETIANRLRQMGAQIFPRIRKSTTHVIFKEGRKSTRDIAMAKGIHLVSVLWVESCGQRKCHVPESEYPANIPKVYDSPLFCKKFQKSNSMQPKDFIVKFPRKLKRLEKILMQVQENSEKFKIASSFIDSEAYCLTKFKKYSDVKEV